MQLKKQKLMESRKINTKAFDLKKAVDLEIPAIVYGNTGKSEIILEFHKTSEVNNKIIEMDSREITDIKTLGGFYSIETGEVKYRQGMLIEAMLNGDWVLFKRIDMNYELLQFLRPIIKHNKLLGNDGIEVQANKNFRIFFTAQEAFEMSSAIFYGPVEFKVEDVMNLFQTEEIKILLKKIFSVIKEENIKFYELNSNNYLRPICEKVKGGECKGTCIKESFKCSDKHGWCIYENGILCSQHFRALIKTHKRLEDIDVLNEVNRRNILQTVTNIFLLHDSESLKNLLVLKICENLTLPGTELAKTDALVWGLSNLILNIKNKEYTLLVGETGAGKTASVQYLNKKAKYFFGYETTLKIVNMSSDFDGSDLIGGYQSLNIEKNITNLYKKVGIPVPLKSDVKENIAVFIDLIEKNVKKYGENFSKELIKEATFNLGLVGKQAHFVYKEGILVKAMKEGYWLLLDEINLCSEETLNLIDAILAKKKIYLYEAGTTEPIKVHPHFVLFACMNPSGDFGKKRYETYEFNIINFYDFSTSFEDLKLVIRTILKHEVEKEHEDKIASLFWELKNMITKKELSNIATPPLITGRTLTRALKMILERRYDGGVFDMAVYRSFDLFFFTQLNIFSRSIAYSIFLKYFNITQEAKNLIETRHGFVLTPKVRIYLNNLIDAVKTNQPVLLQGDTSTGKTSLVFFLAKEMNKKVIRINNHEHTEAADYLGNYRSTEEGIIFKEGALITAMRRGDWIILDELNLAPSDVLEVLNRLLDDNKQIYLPEIDEVIEPHTDFRIFATQNIAYGGRKGLSKAFRNRFIELFFAEKDEMEIFEILHNVSKLPKSFCKCLVDVYVNLKAQRSINSLITLRDLFKWAKRGPSTYEELYEIGLDIVYERQRSDSDRESVLKAFNVVFKKKIFDDKMNQSNQRKYLESFYLPISTNDPHFVLTKSFKKIISLVISAWKNKEPVLLVGETGIGKTKICDIVTDFFKSKLDTLNMHFGIENTDFIGNFAFENSSIVWRDGVLVKAMKNGRSFLIDEINLAEDSVLERLNSLLEDDRIVYIAEIDEEVVAHEDFRIFATMNPGTDFGKRELSPALRNRFTEIYFEIDNEEYPLIFDSMVEKQLVDGICSSLERESFKTYFRECEGNFSVRKMELIINFILNHKTRNFGIVQCLDYQDMQKIWFEALEMAMISFIAPNSKESNESGSNVNGIIQKYGAYSENNEFFGVFPYFIPNLNTSFFKFGSETASINLQRILKAMTLGKAIMLEGDPGIGKTSIIQNIAKKINKRCLRINLSEQTELSDLVGTYLPIEGSIRFVESELLHALESGDWIILDEVNLCTQSVIEGLNPVLDYRKMLFIPERNVKVNKDTRIFATLNPFNSRNGRKILPKSFLDRFVRISMEKYTEEDIEYIVSNSFSEPILIKGIGLREAIRVNQIGKYFEPKETKYLLNDNFLHIGSAKVFFTQKGNSNENLILKDKLNKLTVNCHEQKYNSNAIMKDIIDQNYVIIHSQIQQIETAVKAIINRIPIILSGSSGKTSLVNFISAIFKIEALFFNCHKGTDTCDLLGQYQKTERGFEWKNSSIIDGAKEGRLIVFVSPEFVEKSAFDRLNSMFEDGREINIYEKGIDTKIEIHSDTRFIIISNNFHGLSPALIDRCINIKLDDHYDYIDVWKMFMIKSCEVKPSYKDFCNNFSIDKPKIFLPLREYRYLNKLPDFLNITLSGVYNSINESEIDNMFEYVTENISVLKPDDKMLEFYKSIIVNIQSPVNDIEALENLKTLKENDIYSTVYFIKSSNISVVDRIKISEKKSCILNFPTSLYDLKIKVIESCYNKKIEDYKLLKKVCSKLCDIRGNFTLDFDETYFEFIKNQTTDPLNLIKNDIEYKKAEYKNRMMKKIYVTIKNIYKYGTGSIIDIVNEYDKNIEIYNDEIKKIEKMMERDYDEFRQKVNNLDFCSYVHSDMKYWDQFSDIFNYYLIFLFKQWIQGEGCSGKCKISNLDKNMVKTIKTLDDPNYISYKILCYNLMKIGLDIIPYLEYIDCGKIREDFAKYLYELYYEMPVDPCTLIFDGICFDFPVGVTNIDWIDVNYVPEESFIDKTLRSLFRIHSKAQIIENRRDKILIDEKMVLLLDEIKERTIFTTPEEILDWVEEMEPEYNRIKKIYNENVGPHVTQQGLEVYTDENVPEAIDMIDEEWNKRKEKWKRLHDRITLLYKSTSTCDVEMNHKYLLYLLRNPLTLETAERYFLDCSVYEFLERIYHAKKIYEKTNSLLVYNLTLQYLSFEVDKLADEKIKTAKSKLKKEPKMWKMILDDLKAFLIMPVTTVINLKFNEPSPICQKIHPDVYTYMIANRTDCECNDWVTLSNNFNREEINRFFKDNKTTKKEIVDLFYNRVPEIPFSNVEIALAKVVNQVIEDPVLLAMTKMGIEAPFIPFLYFVFKYAHETSETEDGTGLKSGTGEKNISEQIEEEDEIDNDYGEEQNDVKEEDGVDLDNDGNLSTDNEEKEKDEKDQEEGVDGEEKESSTEEEDDNSEDFGDQKIDVDEGVGEDGDSGSIEIEENAGEGDNGNNNGEKQDIDDKEDIPEYSDESEDLDDTGSEETEGEDLQDESNDEKEDAKKEFEKEQNDELNTKYNVNEYMYKEGKLNNNQSCNNADNYDRRVFGDNMEEKVLCAGEGDELAEGNKGEGDGENIKPLETYLNMVQRDYDCTKLIALLKVIMESNQNSKYKGDYKSGKKLNMKRLIPYIASGYKRDKIWMKRQKSDKKSYILRIFVDNSKSMYSQEMADTLLSIYSKLNRSFSILGIPIEIYKFGQSLERCSIEEINFNESQTLINWIEDFTDGINIILTDGIFQTVGHYNPNFLVLLIDKNDVKKMSKVSVCNGSLIVEKYLDVLPLRYCVIESIDDLESIFISSLSELIKTIEY